MRATNRAVPVVAAGKRPTLPPSSAKARIIMAAKVKRVRKRGRGLIVCPHT